MYWEYKWLPLFLIQLYELNHLYLKKLSFHRSRTHNYKMILQIFRSIWEVILTDFFSLFKKLESRRHIEDQIKRRASSHVSNLWSSTGSSTGLILASSINLITSWSPGSSTGLILNSSSRSSQAQSKEYLLFNSPDAGLLTKPSNTNIAIALKVWLHIVWGRLM